MRLPAYARKIRISVTFYTATHSLPGEKVTPTRISWLQGPAIIEQMDTTTVVMPGDTLTVDAHGNLILSIAS